MSGTNKKTPERITLSEKPTVIVSRRLQDQIDFLHRQEGHIEWSGELITREEGSINDPLNWKIICEDLYLADIGTGSFTGYDVGKGAWQAEDVMNMYEQFPGLMEGTHKNFHAHSHHQMSAFFSSTDWSQMEDRTETCNYLLMLIVNISGNYCAKVGYRAKKDRPEPVPTTTRLKMVNNTDGYTDIELDMHQEPDPEYLVIMDCNIESEGGALVEQRFLDRWKYVKDEKKTYKPTYSNYGYNKDKKDEKTSKWGEDKSLQKTSQALIEFDKDVKDSKPKTNWEDNHYSSYGYNNAWDNDGWDNDAPGTKKEKSIGEMSEKEYAEYYDRTWGAGSMSVVRDYTDKDIYMFLNCVLDKQVFRNSHYPGDRLNKINHDKKLRNAFLERLEGEAFEYFIALFPNTDDEDYVAFLKAMKKLLTPHQHGAIFKYSIDIINKLMAKMAVVN